MTEWADNIDDFTGRKEWHAVYTIQLGELIDSGLFDWKKPELDWSNAAYDADQYKRICDYFNNRFYWREISLLPIKQWFMVLHTKLIYELMPKYAPLYAHVEEGINPFAESDEYYKRRTINSAYPETLLSGNADYISDGTDEEYERVKEGSLVEKAKEYMLDFKSVDESLLDELESMFCCMYTANVNGW